MPTAAAPPSLPASRRQAARNLAFEIAEAKPRPMGDQDPVDVENKVIRGVKILGVESKNTARVLGLERSEFGDAVDPPYGYTIEAWYDAVPLYEGAKVFSNHTPFDFDGEGRRIIKNTERGKSAPRQPPAKVPARSDHQ